MKSTLLKTSILATILFFAGHIAFAQTSGNGGGNSYQMNPAPWPQKAKKEAKKKEEKKKEEKKDAVPTTVIGATGSTGSSGTPASTGSTGPTGRKEE